MTKPFAHCSLPDFALEISLAARAAAGSALDAAAAAQLLPRLADAEATEAVLQRPPPPPFSPPFAPAILT